MLDRLGIDTLGAFAALESSDVLARFGREGRRAQLLAAGLDDRKPAARPAPVDRSVATEFDPLATHTEQVAFAARSLAEDLHRRLAEEAVAAERVAVEVTTTGGDVLVGSWRHGGGRAAGDIADRVRRLLADRPHNRPGALGRQQGQQPPSPPTACRADRPGAPGRPEQQESSVGIARLVLIPQEVGPAEGRQVGFWGTEAAADERAARAVARLCGRLGHDAVRVPVPAGGRHPDEQFRLLPANSPDLAARNALAGDDRPSTAGPAHVGSPPAGRSSLTGDDRPWPGRLPAPSPTRLLVAPWPAQLLDEAGAPVAVTGRGALTAPPGWLVLDGRRTAVAAWAGPWPTEERWWDRARYRRRARFQVLTADGLACLVTLEGGTWHITAVWD